MKQAQTPPKLMVVIKSGCFDFKGAIAPQPTLFNADGTAIFVVSVPFSSHAAILYPDASVKAKNDPCLPVKGMATSAVEGEPALCRCDVQWP